MTIVNDLILREWHGNARAKLQDETKGRLHKRCDVLQTIIQEQLKENGYGEFSFWIPSEKRSEICANVGEIIRQNRMPRKVDNAQDCYKKTRMWWHRDKSKFLGSFLFKPVLFDMLLPGLLHHGGVSRKQHLKAFLSIFMTILASNIRFPSTAPRPIVCQQCFLANNKFKAECDRFVRHFGYEWHRDETKIRSVQTAQGKKNKYVSNKSRCKDIVASFIAVLDKMRAAMEQQSDEFIQLKIQEWYAGQDSQAPNGSAYALLKLPPRGNNTIEQDPQQHISRPALPIQPMIRFSLPKFDTDIDWNMCDMPLLPSRNTNANTSGSGTPVLSMSRSQSTASMLGSEERTLQLPIMSPPPKPTPPETVPCLPPIPSHNQFPTYVPLPVMEQFDSCCRPCQCCQQQQNACFVPALPLLGGPRMHQPHFVNHQNDCLLDDSRFEWFGGINNTYNYGQSPPPPLFCSNGQRPREERCCNVYPCCTTGLNSNQSNQFI